MENSKHVDRHVGVSTETLQLWLNGHDASSRQKAGYVESLTARGVVPVPQDSPKLIDGSQGLSRPTARGELSSLLTDLWAGQAGQVWLAQWDSARSKYAANTTSALTPDQVGQADIGKTWDQFFCIANVPVVSGKHVSNSDVVSLRALSADYDVRDDARDGVYPTMDAAINAISNAPLVPSAVIATGGGFHALWVLDLPIDTTERDGRDYAIRLLRAWARAVGSTDTPNLTTQSRVPGSHNSKYVPPRRVEFLPGYEYAGVRYTADQVEALVDPDDLVIRGPARGETPTVDSPDKIGYGNSALAGICAEVTAARNGRNNELNRQSFKAGQLVGSGCVDLETARAALTDAALQAGLDMRETQATVRSGLDAGMLNPRAPTPRPGPANGEVTATDGDDHPDLPDAEVEGEPEPDLADIEVKIAQACGMAGQERVNAIRGIAGLIARLSGRLDRMAMIESAKKSKLCTKQMMEAAMSESGKSGVENPRGLGFRVELVSDDYVRIVRSLGYEFSENELTGAVDIRKDGGPWHQMEDPQLRTIRMMIRDYGSHSNVDVSISQLEDTIVATAHTNKRNPITEYWNSLPRWDGHDHIGDLAKHFKSEDGLIEAWLRHWIVGIVARFREGYQNPMLVLKGSQNLGKSYFAKWLCGGMQSHFFSGPIQPDNKDCVIRQWDVLVWEVAELASTTGRANLDALKAFLTLPSVRARPPYGQRDRVAAAISSFIGTVNSDSFLFDDTGNRRYLVAAITTIDWGYSKSIDVRQVWAQAIHIYGKDDSWRLSLEQQKTRDITNATFVAPNSIHDLVTTLVSTGTPDQYVTHLEVVTAITELHGYAYSKSLSIDVSAQLAALGGRKSRLWKGNANGAVAYYGLRMACQGGGPMTL